MVRGLITTLVVAVGLWLLGILILFAFGRSSAARELATLIPNLVFLFRGLLRDPRVPRSSKTLDRVRRRLVCFPDRP